MARFLCLMSLAVILLASWTSASPFFKTWNGRKFKGEVWDPPSAKADMVGVCFDAPAKFFKKENSIIVSGCYRCWDQAGCTGNFVNVFSQRFQDLFDLKGGDRSPWHNRIASCKKRTCPRT